MNANVADTGLQLESLITRTATQGIARENESARTQGR
jgi:hypothetical protein